MDGACSTHKRDDNFVKMFVGDIRGRDHLIDLGVDGKIFE
jgi:hypothetical protein